MTVACENGKHHVVSTMLKELHAPTHREVYEELLRRNEAKVCMCTTVILVCFTLPIHVTG